jgi:F0F1-type ATP synthase delta subunit
MKKSAFKLAQFVAENLDGSNVKSMAQSIFAVMRKARDEKNLENLVDLIEEKKALLDGNVVIKMFCAAELTNIEQKLLDETLKKKYGKDAIIRYSIDESLLRGIRLEIADQAIDFSAKTKLKRLKNKLSGGI